MSFILEMMSCLVPLEHTCRNCLKAVLEGLSGQVGDSIKMSENTHRGKNRILPQEIMRVEKCLKVVEELNTFIDMRESINRKKEIKDDGAREGTGKERAEGTALS